MSVTRVQTNQLRTLNALEKLGIVVDDTIETVLAQLDKEADTPLRISPSSPADLTVNIGSIRVERGDNVTETVSPINSTIPNFTGGSVQFPTSSGTITVTGGPNETLPTLANNESINVGISLSSSGELTLSFGPVYANVADQYLPANQPVLPSNELPIGIVLVRKNGSGNLQGNNGATAGEFQTGDIIQFTASGSGGGGFSEQALLFQMLADNNMENIAFGSFDGSTEDIIQTANNMTLNQGNGEYIPDEVGQFYLWSGSREPDIGATGTTFTKVFGGSGNANLSTNPNELTITDVNDGTHQYQISLGGAAGDQFYIDFTMRIPSWTTYVTDADSDANTMVGFIHSDGARQVRIFFVRENGTSGERQIKIADGSNSSINDIDGNDARYNIDWSKEHRYEWYTVRGEEGHLYVDGQLALRIDLTTSTSTTSTALSWGTYSSGSSAGTHVWREFNLRRFRSTLETKVLNYRGSQAFEGDGTPGDATSAGTIQEITGSDDLFIEDNWNAADSTIETNTTVTTVNAGEPNARLQGVVAGSGRHFYRWNLDTDTNLGANPYISARLKLVNVDNQSTNQIGILGMALDNRDIRLVGDYVDANTFDVRLGGNTTDTEVIDATTGANFRFAEGEEAVLELRKVNDETIQFLVNGQVRQECPFDVFGGNPVGERVFVGLVSNTGASDALTWQWSEIRIGDSDADSYLPKNPIQEAIAAMDLEANVSTWISVSSDGGINWTAPKKVGIDGSSPLLTIPGSIAGGKIKARILSYGNDDARISNLALLYNSSANSGGLGTQFVFTFDPGDFSSEPGDQILEHNLKAAEDELLLFGGTEFLTKDLDWFHVDSDRILIKNAVSGVPYEVRRIGFNFGETKNTVVVDREDVESIEPWRTDWNPVITPTAGVISAQNVKFRRFRRIGRAVEFDLDIDGIDQSANAFYEVNPPFPIDASAITEESVVAYGTGALPSNTTLTARANSSGNILIRRGDLSAPTAGSGRSFRISGRYVTTEENTYREQRITNVSNVGNNDTGVLAVTSKDVEVLGEEQTKILQSDFSTNNATVSDFTFTNLVIGQKYLLNVQVQMQLVSTDFASLTFFNGSDTVGQVSFNPGTAPGDGIAQFGNTVSFVATSTNLTFETASLSAGGAIRGDGTKSRSFVQLREINTERVVESVEGYSDANVLQVRRKTIRVLGETETKLLTASISSDTTDIADLRFTDLEIGQKYILRYQVHFFGRSGDNVEMDFFSGTTLLSSPMYEGSAATTDDDQSRHGGSVEFVAEATTLTVDVQGLDSSGSQIFGGGGRRDTWVQLTKIQEEKIIDAIGASPDVTVQNLDRAEDGEPGILRYANRALLDLTGSGDYTGGKLLVERLNQTVTVTIVETATFPSDTQPQTASGFIPDWARAAGDVHNVSYSDSSEQHRISVDSDGTFELLFRTNGGGTVNRTNSPVSSTQLSISYMVGNSLNV